MSVQGPVGFLGTEAFQRAANQGREARLGAELELRRSGMEKTLQSPLDCKEIQPVNPKGNQS